VSVVFDIALMQSDLKAFSKAASKFIENSARLDEIQVQLSAAVANAKKGDGHVRWTTSNGEIDEPVRTKPSKSHRNHSALAKPMVGEVPFNFSGELFGATKDHVLVSSGGTCIKLRWTADGDECTECHFDIHPNKIGHPTLHIQFVGKIKEIPRLPSFFAHPLDILEFTLMEVFQDKWRRSRSGVACKTHLHNYPKNQRTRILSVLTKYSGWLENADNDAPLESLQATPIPPFNLYPP
jgi:hypothetical protein